MDSWDGFLGSGL